MSTVKHKGRITGTNRYNGGISYLRKQPGITFPSDSMTSDEIKAMSGEVKVYKSQEIINENLRREQG